MQIGRLKVNVYTNSKRASIELHYNEAVSDKLDLTEDDIYSLEFAVKEIKRKLNLE